MLACYHIDGVCSNNRVFRLFSDGRHCILASLITIRSMRQTRSVEKKLSTIIALQFRENWLHVLVKKKNRISQ